jgi:hypothetical protein
METIERAAARRLWQKWGAGKYHTDQSEPLLAIVVGMKCVDVAAPDLPGSWDLTVGNKGVTFLIEKIVSCYLSTLHKLEAHTTSIALMAPDGYDLSHFGG